MKMHMLAVGTFLLLGFARLGAYAQSAGDISGRYLVPKGPSIVEIVREGGGYRVTQVSTPVAKDQGNNGKLRALITDASARPLSGTVNDFDSGKQYQAIWEPSDNGQPLTMKVKIGFMHFSYAWKRTTADNHK